MVLSNEREKETRDLAAKVLSACFTLLGILIGVFGILIAEFKGAGPSYSHQAAVAPFLTFLAATIIFDCLICVIALLNVANYARSRSVLVGGVSIMLFAIAVFIAARTFQMLD